MRSLDCSRKIMSQRITEAEVLTGETPDGSDCEIGCMLEKDLGGCCCDCCHKSCNCGLMGRFPDISTGNQFLTPTQFALLCRLGYHLSGEAVKTIVAAQQERISVIAAEEAEAEACETRTASPTPATG